MDKERLKTIKALEGQIETTTRAYIKKIKKLEAELKKQRETNLKLLRSEFGQICSYCSWEAEKGSWEELMEHIKVCEFHPLKKANDKLAKAEELLKKLLTILETFYEAKLDECNFDNWLGRYLKSNRETLESAQEYLKEK